MFNEESVKDAYAVVAKLIAIAGGDDQPIDFFAASVLSFFPEMVSDAIQEVLKTSEALTPEDFGFRTDWDNQDETTQAQVEG